MAFLKSNKHNHNAGYTLVEVVVASLFLGVIITGLGAMLAHSTEIVGRQEVLVNAYRFCDQALRNPYLAPRYYTESILAPGKRKPLSGLPGCADVYTLDDRRTTSLDDDMVAEATYDVENVSFLCRQMDSESSFNVTGKKIVVRLEWNIRGKKETAQVETIVTAHYAN